MSVRVTVRRVFDMVMRRERFVVEKMLSSFRVPSLCSLLVMTFVSNVWFLFSLGVTCVIIFLSKFVSMFMILLVRYSLATCMVSTCFVTFREWSDMF